MSDTTARHTWVPYVAALAGAVLVLKVAWVLVEGADALSGPMGGVSHLGGVLPGLVAAFGVGLRRRGGRGRRIAIAFGVALLWVAWIIGLGDLLTPVIEVFSTAEHVVDEVPIGVGGLALLVGAYVGWSHDQDRSVPVGTTAAHAAA